MDEIASAVIWLYLRFAYILMGTSEGLALWEYRCRATYGSLGDHGAFFSDSSFEPHVMEELFSHAGVAKKSGFGPTPHRTQGWKTCGVQVQYFGFWNGFPLNKNVVLKPSKKKKCAFWRMNYFGNSQWAEPAAVFAALPLGALPGTQGVGTGQSWEKASGASGAALYH